MIGEYGSDATCTILHVDMDAFFAAVEIRRDRSLRGKPVIVGGTGRRGVVTSASYEARAFGVRSAMPIAQARRLCPHGIYRDVDMAACREASAAVMAIFRDVTPLVEPLSVDEAFLDVAGARRLLGSAAQVAQLIRRRTAEELGLTCSVGVASTKFIAKLGSTMAKPDGIVTVGADQVLAFLHPLPVRALWGVGERTHQTLSGLGAVTVGDVHRLGLAALRRAVGAAAAAHLTELAAGRDPRRVTPHRVDRSIGAEETFAHDLAENAAIRRELLRLSERVARRLRTAGQVAKTISIKVRFADFTTLSRSRTLPAATNLARDLYRTAGELFEGLALDRPLIRLLGIRGEQLAAMEKAGIQLALNDPEPGRWQQAEDAIQEVARRFGSRAIRPAILVDNTDTSCRDRP